MVKEEAIQASECLPLPFRNVLITYEKTFREGPYGIRKRKAVTTRLGFLSNLWGKVEFAVPPGWAEWNGSVLPNGWGGDKVPLDKVISWRHVKDRVEEERYAYR